MANLLKTEAIVLRKRNLLDKDILITLFTKEYGKVQIVAKGVKKTTSRRAPHLQTANLLDVIYNLSSNKGKYLSQTTLLSAFSQIKNDHRKVNYLYIMLFVLDRLLPEEQVEENTYQILKRFLVTLSKKSEFDDDACARYLSETLSTLGYVNEPLTLSELISIVEETINEKVPLHTL